MIAGIEIKIGYVTLITLLLQMVCHPYASIWYILPVCKI